MAAWLRRGPNSGTSSALADLSVPELNPARLGAETHGSRRGRSPSFVSNTDAERQPDRSKADRRLRGEAGRDAGTKSVSPARAHSKVAPSYGDRGTTWPPSP